LRVIIEERQPGGLPVLEIYNPDMAGNPPIVIVLHGFNSSKERNMSDSYRLVKKGFYVVAMDAWRHGDLMDEAFAQLSRMERNGDFWNIVIKTTPMLKNLVDYYATYKKADGSRIGLLGRSMGGMVIYDYLTTSRSSKIKSAVVLVSTPAWASFERKFFQKNPVIQPLLNPDTSRKIAENEPVRKLASIRDFPLLLINGVNDPVIPIDDVRESFTKLQMDYEDKTRVRLSEYEGTGHQVTTAMIDEAADWFGKYL
jgi:dienelactone hydrolase